MYKVRNSGIPSWEGAGAVAHWLQWRVRSCVCTEPFVCVCARVRVHVRCKCACVRACVCVCARGLALDPQHAQDYDFHTKPLLNAETSSAKKKRLD